MEVTVAFDLMQCGSWNMKSKKTYVGLAMSLALTSAAIASDPRDSVSSANIASVGTVSSVVTPNSIIGSGLQKSSIIGSGLQKNSIIGSGLQKSSIIGSGLY